MSLESSRGRFSQKKISRADFANVNKKSYLSKIGKKPLESIISKSNILIEKKDTNQNSANKIDEKAYTKREICNREQQKMKANSRKQSDSNLPEYEFDKQFDFTEKKKKKIDIKTIVAMIVIEVFTIALIIAAGKVVRMSRMTQQVRFNKKEVKNTSIDTATVEKMKGYLTVALFGLDNRNDSLSSGNADVNKIVHLNLETGDLKIISVYRDLFLSITNNNSYGKLNAAYSRGGPENAVKVLNKNLDLDISNYFSFNWKSVADVIDLLGGIDVEITKSEMKYFNAFIHETCVSTGISAKNPAAFYIKQSGVHHLYGVQAVAYARLRLSDNDIKRTERQNTVIKLCLEKAKQLEPSKLIVIADYILPQISYEFDMTKLISLAPTVHGISLSESYGFPNTQNFKMINMGSHGSCLVPNSLESAVKKLHKYMYDTEEYTPSSAVRSYSNRILELTREYEAQNKIKEENKTQEKSTDGEEVESTTKNNNVKSTNASSTNKKQTVNSTSETTTKADEGEVLEHAPYEEEPEEEETNATQQQNNNQVKESSAMNQANGPVSAPMVVPEIANPSQKTNTAYPVVVPGNGPIANDSMVVPMPMGN